MIDTYAAALLLEQAGFEQSELGSDRKQLVARLYVRAHLADPGPLRGSMPPPEELQRFKDLCDGAFVDDQPRAALERLGRRGEVERARRRRRVVGEGVARPAR